MTFLRIQGVTLQMQAEEHIRLNVKCPVLMSNFDQTSDMPTKVSKTHQYQNTQKSNQQFRRCWTDRQSKDKLRAFTNFPSESRKKQHKKRQCQDFNKISP